MEQRTCDICNKLPAYRYHSAGWCVCEECNAALNHIAANTIWNYDAGVITFEQLKSAIMEKRQ